jgi:hypothetical protein
MRILMLLLISTGLAIGCREPSNNTGAVYKDPVRYQPKPSIENSNDIEVKIDAKERPEEASCEFKDGTHAATVDYYNPQTGHIAKYELQVHVEDCKVIKLDFPNGGWLDESHIPATAINDNGDATLKDDKKRIWKVHLQ